MALPREVKVGFFVLAGMIVSGIVVFLIGDERGLFKSTDPYSARFSDVQGLKRGSPVRMGGLDIGTVTEVAYPEDPSDRRPYVRMTIHREQGARIRDNSVATIENRGLLGDKMVQITAGDMDVPAVPVGGEVRSKDPQDLADMLKKVTSIGEKAEGVMTNLERTTGTFAEPKFQEDMKTSMKSLSGILESVDKKEGYIGKLMSDPNESAKISRTLSNLERTTANLDRLVSGLNAAVHRVNHGPGLVHELVYGEAPPQTLNKFGDAAGEVALTLKGIREGKGMAHSLLYGGEGEEADAVKNINAMSADLRKVVADLRAGRGTLGALLVDPSVYEDLKMLLGNVQRNQVLRALVRYSIKQDEASPSVKNPDGKTPKAAAGAASGKESGPKPSAAPPPKPALKPPSAGQRFVAP
ncbi:MAG: MCE family protein [Polyangiaceae bacterium]|nr:MCE family protein [Polyangiaceae bacterium]MCB9608069.1 MCE family protein [Polyangiaceae bacterium]